LRLPGALQQRAGAEYQSGLEGNSAAQPYFDARPAATPRTWVRVAVRIHAKAFRTASTCRWEFDIGDLGMWLGNLVAVLSQSLKVQFYGFPDVAFDLFYSPAVVMHVVTRVARYRGLLVSRPARRVYTTKGNSRRPADIVLGASV
jgi:hypothetical protein